MDLQQFANQSVHVMAKPIGPICNLDCEYCYYLHKEDLYPKGERWRMEEPALDTYIRQYIEAQPAAAPEITFAWQGGEPTLLGVDFFRHVVELQNKYAIKGQRIANALQTNGILIDDEWCEFFVENKFLIGLSIDGPAELHDRYRYDKKGNPSFPGVMNCLNLFKKHDVEFNALVVVNRHNGDHGKRVYTYLRDNGVKFMQFIPIVEEHGIGRHGEMDVADGELESLVSTRSVLPEQFGDFLIEVYQEWLRRDVGTVFVQIFDQALSAWMGVEPSLCVFRKNCGRAMAIEHNGDVFCCDHFVEPDYRLGNIMELPIVEMANSDRQMKFGTDKQTTLPQYCRDCEVRFACNGECPKNRFINTPDGEVGLNYLCGGYRKFFNHIDPTMKMMVEELKQRRPAANVMQRLNPKKATAKAKAAPSQSMRSRQPNQRAQAPGRNDPCPCGSGKKFKRCCFRR